MPSIAMSAGSLFRGRRVIPQPADVERDVFGLAELNRLEPEAAEAPGKALRPG
jgi:hypothetical protein